MIEQLVEHLPGMVLVVARIGGLMVFAPVLSAASIPTRHKVGLAVLMGIAVYPTLIASEVGTPPPLELWSLAPLFMTEVALGALIGYLASLPLVIAQVGGQLMSQQMGLAFAQIVNPATDSQDDVLSQAIYTMLLGAILILGGLEWMIAALFETFHYVPFGAFAVDHSVADLMTGILNASYEVSMRIATPVLCAVFFQSIAMGYLSKATPQFNILSLGFPLRILIGVTMVIFGLNAIEAVSITSFGDSFDMILSWIGGRDG